MMDILVEILGGEEGCMFRSYAALRSPWCERSSREMVRIEKNDVRLHYRSKMVWIAWKAEKIAAVVDAVEVLFTRFN